PDAADRLDPNSNHHIEAELGVTPMGDACEPVPLVGFKVPPHEEVAMPVQSLDLYTMLGKHESILSSNFVEPTTFRQCNCIYRTPSGEELRLNEEQCISTSGCAPG